MGQVHLPISVTSLTQQRLVIWLLPFQWILLRLKLILYLRGRLSSDDQMKDIDILVEILAVHEYLAYFRLMPEACQRRYFLKSLQYGDAPSLDLVQVSLW